MRTFCLFLILFVLASVWRLPAHAAPASREDNLRQLREIEERINETLDAIDKKRTAEIDLLSELDDLDRDLNMKQQRVAKTKKRLDQLTRDLSDQKRKLEERQKDVDKLQARVQQRLVALYKSEETGTLKTIFSSTSTSQMIEDYDFLGRIVGHDRTLLDDYRQRLKERQNAIRKLAAIRDSQQKALAELQRDEKALVETRDLKKRFLAAVRRDRTALNSVMTELRKRAASLTALVEGLESGKPGEYTEKTALFPLQKGLLPWPVKGPIKVGFGTKQHPELGTLIESHGIEIATAPDTEINAVWDGRVAFAKRFQGFGNLLIIDHDDGYYTLYAQAAELLKKAGDRVRKGEKIAISGYNGADFVYFEIRRGSTPLDPVGWITRR